MKTMDVFIYFTIERGTFCQSSVRCFDGISSSRNLLMKREQDQLLMLTTETTTSAQTFSHLDIFPIRIPSVELGEIIREDCTPWSVEVKKCVREAYEELLVALANPKYEENGQRCSVVVVLEHHIQNGFLQSDSAKLYCKCLVCDKLHPIS